MSDLRKSLYIIRSTDQSDGDVYWSNTDGWVDYENATLFTKTERDTVALPMGGEWRYLPLTEIKRLSNEDLKRQIRLAKLHLEWLEREEWVRKQFPNAFKWTD